MPLQASGQLQFVDLPNENGLYETPFPFQVYIVNGHTEAQMIPLLDYKGEKVLFAADLLPSVGHIPLPYVMGYDVRPLLTLTEKSWVLNEVVEQQIKIFFEHDSQNEMCSLKATEKGPRLDEVLSLIDLS